MNLTEISGLIIFIAMGVSTAYFSIKSRNIAMKYLTWRDITFRPFSTRKKIPEGEWKRMKKNNWYAFLCFFGGLILIILLYIL